MCGMYVVCDMQFQFGMARWIIMESTTAVARFLSATLNSKVNMVEYT